MAKTKLKSVDYLLIGTVAVGGIGYYLYTKGKLPFVDKLIAKIKGETPKSESPTPTSTPEVTPVVQKVVNAKPPVDPTKEAGYVSKVKNIQEYLAVGMDGNAGSSDGSNTNKALKTKFPTLYATEGRLRPTNVDKYIKAINDNKGQQKIKNDAVARKNFGQKLVNLYYKDKSSIVRQTDLEISTRILDKARNEYVVDGGKITIYKNSPIFPKFSIVNYTYTGYFILKTPTGKFIITNPNEYLAK